MYLEYMFDCSIRVSRCFASYIGRWQGTASILEGLALPGVPLAMPLFETNVSHGLHVGLSLLCSKIYLLFLPELSKIYTHCSFFIPIALPIIPFLFYCVSDDITMQE